MPLTLPLSPAYRQAGTGRGWGEGVTVLQSKRLPSTLLIGLAKG